MSGNEHDEFLTVEELADRLKIHPGTIYNWISAGTLDIPYVKIGRAVRFRRTQIDAWIDSKGAAAAVDEAANDPAA